MAANRSWLDDPVVRYETELFWASNRLMKKIAKAVLALNPPEPEKTKLIEAMRENEALIDIGYKLFAEGRP